MNNSVVLDATTNELTEPGEVLRSERGAGVIDSIGSYALMPVRGLVMAAAPLPLAGDINVKSPGVSDVQPYRRKN